MSTATRWKSCAQWHPEVYSGDYGAGDGVSRDIHDTQEQAQTVCDLLNRNGFGGEGKDFPIRTWVEPVTPPTTQQSETATPRTLHFRLILGADDSSTPEQQMSMLWDHAEALERELTTAIAKRDDALGQAKQARTSRHAQEELSRNAFNKWQEQLAAVTRERDEARAAITELIAGKNNADHEWSLENDQLRADLAAVRAELNGVLKDRLAQAKYRDKL